MRNNQKSPNAFIIGLRPSTTIVVNRFHGVSLLKVPLIAGCLIGIMSGSAAAAAYEKTAAQYTAEAEALEAEADRLLQGGSTQPTPNPARTAGPLKIRANTAPVSDRVFAGVYGCMNQDANEMVGLQWGILDGASYSTFDGGRGSYVFDSTTRVITFTSGPFKGLRRLRTEPRLFRVLDEHGAMTAFTCPWTPKDPRKLHW